MPLDVNPSKVTLNDEAVFAVQKWMLGQVAGSAATVALAEPVADGVTTTVVVNNGAGLRGKTLLIDDEAVEVTSRTGGNLTVVRGVLGTVAAPHKVDAPVKILKYATVKDLCNNIVLDTLRRILDSSPPATVLSKREAAKLLEDEAKAAITGAITQS